MPNNKEELNSYILPRTARLRNTIETVSLSRRNNFHANVCAPVELAPSRGDQWAAALLMQSAPLEVQALANLAHNAAPTAAESKRGEPREPHPHDALQG